MKLCSNTHSAGSSSAQGTDVLPFRPGQPICPQTGVVLGYRVDQRDWPPAQQVLIVASLVDRDTAAAAPVHRHPSVFLKQVKCQGQQSGAGVQGD